MIEKIYEFLYKNLLGKDVYKYQLVKKVHDFMSRKIRLKIVEIEGLKFYSVVENISQMHIQNLPETEFCKKEINLGDTVIDIGANIGYFTLIFAKLVGKTGKVISFEPDPRSFKILEKNVELNGFQNVELINKAVSNQNKKVKLFMNTGDTQGSSLKQTEYNKEFHEVEAVSLDNCLEKDEEIKFIKIDVEGVEKEIIEGGKETLLRNKNIVLITEIAGYYLSKNNIDEWYTTLLNNLNFKLLYYSDKNIGKSKIIPIDYEKFKKILDTQEKFIFNLIWKNNI